MSRKFFPKVCGYWFFISTAWALLHLLYSVPSVSAIKVSGLQSWVGLPLFLQPLGSLQTAAGKIDSLIQKKRLLAGSIQNQNPVLNSTLRFPNPTILWDTVGSRKSLLWKDFSHVNTWGFYLCIIVDSNPFRLFFQHLKRTLPPSQFKNIYLCF